MLKLQSWIEEERGRRWGRGDRGGGPWGGGFMREEEGGGGMIDDANNIVYWIWVGKKERLIPRSELLFFFIVC